MFKENLLRVRIVRSKKEITFKSSTPGELKIDLEKVVPLLPARPYILKASPALLEIKNYSLIKAESTISLNTKEGQITLFPVPVGEGFHWESEEEASFRGKLEFHRNAAGEIMVINELPLGLYLQSVTSSELFMDAPWEALKAQAVIARSTVWATRTTHHRGEIFELCNTDHCQVYRGLEKITTNSRRAVLETKSEVLSYQGKICDTRYAKICGGIREAYENVWGGSSIPYLGPGIDGRGHLALISTEEEAKQFIDSRPEVYCNLETKATYLQGCKKYFRWEINYERKELETIIYEKTGIDIGELQALIPQSRGVSGRLINLEIVGNKNRFQVGPELEIRRVLSKSHLPSALFYPVLEKQNGKIKCIILRGGGWGHGVGLCQVGACMMAEQGFSYREILAHYYPATHFTSVPF